MAVAVWRRLRYRRRMPRLIGALGIAAVAALVAAILSLLVAVLLVGGDEAVVGALLVASATGVLALPVAWWMLGARPRALPDAEPGTGTGSGAI